MDSYGKPPRWRSVVAKQVVPSDSRLCLRRRDRRQAQAVYGGRYARLDPGPADEGWLGIGCAAPPRISASAQIQPAGDGDWAIVENGEVRAAYPNRAIRLSLVWKAEVRDRELKDDTRYGESVGFDVPSNPLADAAWLPLLQRTYAEPILTRGE
jgi:hypothetical protein